MIAIKPGRFLDIQECEPAPCPGSGDRPRKGGCHGGGVSLLNGVHWRMFGEGQKGTPGRGRDRKCHDRASLSRPLVLSLGPLTSLTSFPLFCTSEDINGRGRGGPLTKWGWRGRGPICHDIFCLFSSRPLFGVPFLTFTEMWHSENFLKSTQNLTTPLAERNGDKGHSALLQPEGGCSDFPT